MCDQELAMDLIARYYGVERGQLLSLFADHAYAIAARDFVLALMCVLFILAIWKWAWPTSEGVNNSSGDRDVVRAVLVVGAAVCVLGCAIWLGNGVVKLVAPEAWGISQLMSTVESICSVAKP